MVQFRRNYVPGGSYFFTLTLIDRRSTLLADRVDLLRQAFRDETAKRPFEILAIVVLPEHLHAVLTLPAGDSDYSQRWRGIKSGFSRAVSQAGIRVAQNARGEYRLWRRRFWEHSIRDERDLQTHVDYIHYNPVKHGWVTRAADWPYSSLHRYVRLGWLNADWGGEAMEFGDQGFGEPEV